MKGYSPPDVVEYIRSTFKSVCMPDGYWRPVMEEGSVKKAVNSALYSLSLHPSMGSAVIGVSDFNDYTARRCPSSRVSVWLTPAGKFEFTIRVERYDGTPFITLD